MRVKCLTQEHNATTRPGLEPSPLDPESSPLNTSHRVSHQVVQTTAKWFDDHPRHFVWSNGNYICYFKNYFRILESSLDESKIRTQDMLHAISGVGAHVYGRLLTWEFIRKNFDKIVKK